MADQDEEPIFSAGNVPPESAETAARIAKTANALVRAAGGSLNPVELATIARTGFEEFVRRDVLPSLDAPPACRRGCAWCCYSGVRVSIAEAVSVAVYILTKKTAAAQEEIRNRLEDYVAEASVKTAEGRLTFRKPCPFLVRDECTVYPVRPLICAGYLSPTPDACERVAKDPDETTLYVQGATEEAGFLSLVLAEMFRAFDAEAEPVDLAGAVKIILDDPTSFDRWHSGNKVFAETFVSKLMGGTFRQEEEDTRRYERALPALLEELGRRAGPKAAASTREAWERRRKDGLNARPTLPTLTPGP